MPHSGATCTPKRAVLSSLIALTRDWEYVASPPTLPLRVFIRRSSPFYGRFFVRGVAVSGGEGVQRKVVVEKAARFFLPPFLHGGVSWDVLPVCLKKDEFSEKIPANGLVNKEPRTSQERAQTLPTPLLLDDIHNLSLTGGTQEFCFLFF